MSSAVGCRCVRADTPCGATAQSFACSDLPNRCTLTSFASDSARSGLIRSNEGEVGSGVCGSVDSEVYPARTRGALTLADEIGDFNTGFLIERALDEARSRKFRPVRSER
jgi:hypothetical protein